MEAEQARVLRKALEGTDEPLPDRTAKTRRHDVDHAEGVPVQVIVGGRPTVSMQRAHWRPDRIADLEATAA